MKSGSTCGCGEWRSRTSGVTACLAPGARLVDAPKILEKKLFDPATGRLAIRELARTHVVHGYLAKSLRCRDCVVTDRCEDVANVIEGIILKMA